MIVQKTFNPSAPNTVILVTGGAGFIGSNFIRFVLTQTDFPGIVVNLDKLTYAGNLESLVDIEQRFGRERYRFEQGDICDAARVNELFDKYQFSVVVHFAAESHVDRSIHGPADFIETNIKGTFILLEAARRAWSGRRNVRFHHISTDEVYGSLGETGRFSESTAYDPRSPYSASKAASDHLVRAYGHTYDLPVTISNCSNNYGPYQFPEKLIPLMILNAVSEKQMPVYGDGGNVRDWLFVADHCEAVWLILQKGAVGETYNIGGESERRNIDVVENICGILDELRPRAKGRYRELITFVSDRPGHDRRYSVDCEKIKKNLGWTPRHAFSDGLRLTVSWYLENNAWVESVKSGEYIKWIEHNYSLRTNK